MSAITNSPLAGTLDIQRYSRPIDTQKPAINKSRDTNKTAIDRSFSGAVHTILKESSGGMKNMVFKPIALGAELMTFIRPDSKGAASIMRIAKDAKNLGEITFLPGKFSDVTKEGAAAFDSPWAFGLFVNRLTDFWVSITDVLKTVCREVLPLSARNATLLELSSSGSTTVGMVLGLMEEGDKRQNATEKGVKDKGGKACYDAQIANSYLNSARNVCYLALGVLGTAMITANLAVSPMVMWAFAVGATAFTFFSNIHKKMVVEKLAEEAGVKV